MTSRLNVKQRDIHREGGCVIARSPLRGVALSSDCRRLYSSERSGMPIGRRVVGTALVIRQEAVCSGTGPRGGAMTTSTGQRLHTRGLNGSAHICVVTRSQ